MKSLLEAIASPLRTVISSPLKIIERFVIDKLIPPPTEQLVPSATSGVPASKAQGAAAAKSKQRVSRKVDAGTAISKSLRIKSEPERLLPSRNAKKKAGFYAETNLQSLA